MLSIFEYLCWKSPEILRLLVKAFNLRIDEFVESRITDLMRHDHYRRVRGALRQMGNGVVIR